MAKRWNRAPNRLTKSERSRAVCGCVKGGSSARVSGSKVATTLHPTDHRANLQCGYPKSTECTCNAGSVQHESLEGQSGQCFTHECKIGAVFFGGQFQSIEWCVKGSFFATLLHVQ